MVCSTREVYGSVKVVRRTPRVSVGEMRLKVHWRGKRDFMSWEQGSGL